MLGSSALALGDPGNGKSANHGRGGPIVVQQETSTPTSTLPTATPTTTSTSTATPTGTPPTAIPTATSTPTATAEGLEERPGLGCGDEHHIHTGAPGNADVTCNGNHGGHNDMDDEEEASEV